MASKTLSLRMSKEDYAFVQELAKEEKQDVSTQMRDLYERGRTLLAIEKYKKSEASLGKAARIAGVPISRMFDILKEHNVPINVELDDYLESLEAARKLW